MAKEIGKDRFDEALDREGFASFLAKKGVDQKDIGNESKMEGHVELFETLEMVQKGYRDLCKEKLSKELGIHLNDADLKSIDSHLEKQAIDKPERIDQLKEKLEKQENLTSNISGWEKKIATFEKNKKDGDKDDLAAFGYFALNLTYGTFIRDRKQKNIENEGDVREEILGEISQISALHDAIKTAVARQLQDFLVAPNSTSSQLNKLQDRFEAMRADGTKGLDLLGKLPPNFQEQINTAISNKVDEEIYTATEAMSLGNGTFSKFENIVIKYLEIKKLGSKEDKQARQIVLDSLKLIATDYEASTDPQHAAKKIMLYRIMHKAESGEYKEN